MHASLPMYDRPEMRAETDRFWALTRDALRDRGIAAPDALTREFNSPWELWQSPDLLLSQTCGLPLRAVLRDKVTLVATPDFALPGCATGHYNSVLITRPENADTPMETLLRGRTVINEGLSQSGWGALCRYADRLGMIPAKPTLSGGHAFSARAVLEGHADLAAIDAQTWRLLLRYEPDLRTLVERDRTVPTPALPLITAIGCDPAPLNAALEDAIAALPDEDCNTLCLAGFTRIPLDDYMALPVPPNPDDLPQ
ncbi:phosphate/phosphite/phosphonate ABC transporter substrate-binding protein [Nioella aestuarii]|uniref:phosphate/phosphite/phosphonate ABC transporter substrate-binding protein n=1 Tax=Nioella aestuarii TaxID=1662864 RepID=UPI003D7FD988